MRSKEGDLQWLGQVVDSALVVRAGPRRLQVGRWRKGYGWRGGLRLRRERGFCQRPSQAIAAAAVVVSTGTGGGRGATRANHQHPACQPAASTDSQVIMSPLGAAAQGQARAPDVRDRLRLVVRVLGQPAIQTRSQF